MTGDLVGASDDIESGCKALAELASICCVFFVPGNHDIVASSRTGSRHRVETLLSKSGVRVLLNRQENDIIRGTRVVIAGVDDLMRGAPDLSIAEAAPGEAGLRILLSHNPDVVLSLPRDSWDLLLCGHTHGGQIRLPLVGPVTTNSRTGRLFWKQPVVFRGIRVFMSQGLGTTLLPIRLLCSPRIDVLKLRSCQRIESAEH